MKLALPSINWNKNQKLLVLIALVIVTYFGAVSRGESLLWLIGAIMLATLIVGFVCPHWLLHNLSITRTGPTRAQEGETILFQVCISNNSYFPKFMVEVFDWIPFANPIKKTLPIGNCMLGIVGYVGGKSHKIFDVPLICEKRGFYQLGPSYLATNFPLGLIEAQKRKPDSVQTLMIYPEIFEIKQLPLHGTLSQINNNNYILPKVSGTSHYIGLRDYRRGDSPRHIHWRTTARLNKLMIREFEALASTNLYLTLDLAEDTNIGFGRHSTLEYAIKITASIAYCASVNNIPYRLVSDDTRLLSTKIESGSIHYQNTLDNLAIIDSKSDAIPYKQLIEKIATSCKPGESVLVFLSGTLNRIKDTLQAISLLHSRGAHIIAISLDQHTFIDELASTSQIDDSITAALLRLNIHAIHVARGDNLFQTFNQ